MTDPGAIAFLAARPALNVVRDPSRLPERREGEHRADISGAEVNDREALLDRLATELLFPEWTGRNWDALSDSLRDLSWLGDAGVVLVVTQAEEMLRQAPRASAHLLEVWSSAALAQAERDRALQLFLAFGE